jgi:hypothetical protein
MNSINNLVDEVLETSRVFFAQVDASNEPAVRHQTAHATTHAPVYPFLSHGQLSGPTDSGNVFEAYPQGIRELSSPLSD